MNSDLEIKNLLLKIYEGQVRIEKRLGRLENIVTVMQQEDGDKLDALFDAFKMQNEKLFLFEERLEKDERKIERNENQIYNLSLEIKSS